MEVDAQTAVDIQTIIEWVLTGAATVLMPVVVYLLRRWVGIQLSDSNRQALQNAMYWAADHAAQKLREKGITKFSTNNIAIDQALYYVSTKMPGAMAQLGVTHESLRQMVQARLAVIENQDAAKVAPPAPPPKPPAKKAASKKT